ncbi:MAG: alpha/beta hydrolase, partial [Arcobacteraceae bacterium]|nr:alpha/beta hydrolase [Arcobacteraceae bacterium]
MQKNLYLFIHGIGSDQSTWNQYISILKDDHDINIRDTYFEESDEEIENYYTFFNYDSPIIDKKPFFSWGNKKKTGTKKAGDLTVSSHSDALLSFIEHEENKYNNIYILAHSMGGLITLDCIFKLINTNKPKLIKKLKKVIFFATPIAGSDDADDIKKYF